MVTKLTAPLRREANESSDRSRQSGFTLLEVLISMVVLSVLLGVVLSISVETAKFTAFADDEYIVQNEAQRSISKLTEILRKTGWVTIGGVTFPQVWNDGDEIDFVLNSDSDGNGYAFDETTGELEWSPIIYSARRDSETGTFGIYVGEHLIWILGSNISDVDFVTNVEDSSVQFKEIRVTIQSDRVTPDGTPVNYQTTSSIHMRN